MQLRPPLPHRHAMRWRLAIMLCLVTAISYVDRQALSVAALPFVAADLGALFGGWLGSRMIARGVELDRARKRVIWLGALLVPVALPAVFVESPFLAVLLVSGALFAIQVKQASLFAVPTDLFPARDVAAVWGLSGAAGSLAAAFAQPVVGWLIDDYLYTPVFVIVSFMHIVSALAVTVLIRRIEPVQPKRRLS